MIDHNVGLRQIACGLGLSVFVCLSTACSGPLFKVKPAVELPALPASARTAESGGVRLSVAPLLSDEESQELFEANLPLGGVLPLRVELNYQNDTAPLELKRARFHLCDGEGHEWKFLTTKQAISRILKTNGGYLYNPYSRKEFEKDFTAYAIDLKAPLPASERRRQGFLFFQTSDKSPVRSPRGLVLFVSGLTQPLEIRLN